MPIRELHDDGVTQECIACGRIHHLELDALGLDAAPAADAQPVIRVPPCDCGAHEFLIVPEAEHPTPGSFAHLHGLLVRALHARVANSDGDEATKELHRWLPDGLRLGSSRGDNASEVVDA